MKQIISKVYTKKDSREYFDLYFDLQEDMLALQLSATFEPTQSPGQHYENRAMLSLFDPEGQFRGFCFLYGEKVFMLSSNDASPGFMRGHLTAGKWRIIVAVARVLGNHPVQLDLEITASPMNLTGKTHFPQPENLQDNGSGWYRGDLHTHSNHSDGRWSVADLVGYARRFNLDFVTLSDHNTVSGLETFHSLGGGDLVTISGQELTTFYGHALVLGSDKWLDWGTLNKRKDPHFLDLAEKAILNGNLLIPAHINNVGEPDCGGCNWQYADMMPGAARIFEIWNGPWDSEWSNNETTLQQVYKWLNEGYHIAMTAGTDHHGLRNSEAYIKSCGFSIVNAQSFTQQGILEGIRHGRLYLSQGPRLQFTAMDGDDPDKNQAGIGGTLHDAKTIQLHAAWQDTHPDDTIRLILNGHTHTTICSHRDQAHWQIKGQQARWAVVEVRSKNDVLRAISNPIYFE